MCHEFIAKNSYSAVQCIHVDTKINKLSTGFVHMRKIFITKIKNNQSLISFIMKTISLAAALQLAAQEKGKPIPTIKVTFNSLKRGGKFRAQIHAKGQTYMISGKEGLVSLLSVPLVVGPGGMPLEEFFATDPQTLLGG